MRSVSQTLCWCSGSWVPPDAGHCSASCGESIQRIPGGWRNLYHWLASTLTWPNAVAITPLGHDASVHPKLPSRISDYPGNQWCPGPELGGNTPGPHVSFNRSVPFHVCGGHPNYRIPFWATAMKIQQTGLSRHIFFFTLIFWVSLNSAPFKLIVFISIKGCGIFSLLTHHPVHISTDTQHDFFPHWDLMCFHIVPLIILSSVFRQL